MQKKLQLELSFDLYVILKFAMFTKTGNWRRTNLTTGDVLRLYTACKLQNPIVDHKATIWNVTQQILKPEKAHAK